MFTASPSVVDEEIVEPPTLATNISQVSVSKGSDKFNIEIDL